jgi:dTDP-L-rhamnose 4-epimerase
VRILVTGGTGFIGSHVVEAALAGGHEVVVVDRQPQWPGPDRPDGLEIIAEDLLDPGVCERALRGVDAVSHQAARVGLGVDFADTPGYVRDNDAATARLLDAMWAGGFSGRFVLAGSMVVYGEGRYRCARHGQVPTGPRRAADLDDGAFEPRCPVPGCERWLAWDTVPEDAATDPRNVYAATKLHQEHLCLLWGRERGATAISLRYHNVYGPRMPRDTPYAGVAAIFRSALASGRVPRVFEDGGQTRDLIHVRDVARANLTALTSTGAAPGAYNVASGHPRTVLELARALCSVMDPTVTPEVTGAWRAGDVRHIVADPGRAEAELGFRAEIPFEAGVAELAAEVGPADVGGSDVRAVGVRAVGVGARSDTGVDGPAA